MLKSYPFFIVFLFCLFTFACDRPSRTEEKITSDQDSPKIKIPELKAVAQDTTQLKAKEKTLYQALLGTWLSSVLVVKIKTPAGTKDTVSYIYADPSNWAEVMKIQPIVTTFKNNGVVYTETKDLNGKIIGEGTANWSLRGDSLFLIENTPLRTMLRYRVYIKGAIGEFRGFVDWDKDGFQDDEIVCGLQNIAAKTQNKK
ncbi:MAG: hypothetical protein EAZ57_01360 [Cytophagales bacterium]|nr:MAG: hypothetical protein EAZ67_01915 [Cytophagales bacterium]TAF62098.1 MAG: hypothetical protein EAZ57_01360 [Cytophagales bacterium]